MHAISNTESFLTTSGGYLHNFCGLVRTLRVWQQLSPKENILHNLLAAHWAEVTTSSESSLSTMKSQMVLHLNEIHPHASQYYESKIEQADTVEKMRELAKKLFNSSATDTRELMRTTPAVNVNKLSHLWETALTIPNFEKAKEFISSQLYKIGVLGIQSAYLEDLVFVHNLTSLQEHIRRYQKDLSSGDSTDSVLTTSQGNAGYPKIITWFRGNRIREGFMKHLTIPEEMEQHRLYEFLFSEPEEEHVFKVVPGTMISPFDPTPYHVNHQGIKKALPIEHRDLYQKLTLYLVSACNTEGKDLREINTLLTHIKARPIGFFERINGTGLFDYFKTQYPCTSEEEKEKLFEHFGMIAFFDLVVGQQDRMILFSDSDKPSLRDESDILFSNLDNLMVTSGDQTIALIDNGLRAGRYPVTDLTVLKEHEASYLFSLREILETEDPPTAIADAVLLAITSALNDQDEGLGNVQIFHDDLVTHKKELFKTYLINGIKKMEELLVRKLIPKWQRFCNSQSFSEELITLINSRFAIVLEQHT